MNFIRISTFAFLISFATSLSAQLIDYTKVDSFSVEQLKAKWKKSGIPEMVTPVKYGVDVYDVTYYTTWCDGSKVKASGLYFVPKNINKPVPVLLYNHGTAVTPQRHIGYNGESTICILFATDGYGVLSPDYVGLGHGDKIHLYHHAETEADANIFLFRAAQKINEQNNWFFSDQLFISGYSQGGHATLATHRKIQEKQAEELTVTASSPMSGAYDLTDTQGQVMFREYTQPHYLPYLLIGYNEAYKLWPKKDFFSLFVPPYDTLVPQLFDGEHNVGNINAALPKVPKDMVKKEFTTQFLNNPEYKFREVLQANNVYDWKPEAPVQFCFCKSDEEVMYENSIKAHKVMVENGAKNITLRHVSDKFTHYHCAGYAVIFTKFYFDSFRHGSKKGRKGPPFKRWLIGIDMSRK